MLMRSIRIMSFMLVAVLAMAFIAACNGDDDDGNGNGNGNGGGSVTIETPAIEFDPDSISMNEGENLEVELNNTDTQLHTFTIDDLGIDLEVDGGSSDSVTIEAPDAGEYVFYCSVPGHREAGQEGTLTVN